MAKLGRPRGLTVNPDGVEGMLAVRSMTKRELCEATGISASHLADMLHRAKGASPALVNAMATALRCPPGLLAPELSQWFYVRRPGDDEKAA